MKPPYPPHTPEAELDLQLGDVDLLHLPQLFLVLLIIQKQLSVILSHPAHPHTPEAELDLFQLRGWDLLHLQQLFHVLLLIQKQLSAY